MVCRVKFVGRTNRGVVRERNEDSLLIFDLDGQSACCNGVIHATEGRRGPLWVLCDGMGGEAAGAFASDLASKTIVNHLSTQGGTDNVNVVARQFRHALRVANQVVFSAAKVDRKKKGMGTTVSAALCVGNTLLLAQVGDSRAYILRKGALVQVTRDQSVVDALVRSGQMDLLHARSSKQRGRVLQAVGAAPDVEVSISIVELRIGDRLLLCSDGLHEFVEEGFINTKGCIADIEAASKGLMALAFSAGGQDNISIVLADFLNKSLPEVGENEELLFTELDPSLEGADSLTSIRQS